MVYGPLIACATKVIESAVSKAMTMEMENRFAVFIEFASFVELIVY